MQRISLGYPIDRTSINASNRFRRSIEERGKPLALSSEDRMFHFNRSITPLVLFESLTPTILFCDRSIPRLPTITVARNSAAV